MSDLLIQAMTAKQSGNITLAKQLLSQAIVQNPHSEGAWMLMSEVVDDVKLRRNCLEKVLAINPKNTAASLALTKLNTSPLGPIMRGERSKPFDTPNPEAADSVKTPPFTPPFTWDNQPEQFVALGDLTFPDTPGEEPNPMPEMTPTFDWANESEEPDKTIDKIFEAVSKPELASEPPPQKESSWLDDLRPNEEIVGTEAEKKVEKKDKKKKEEDPWLKELMESAVEPAEEKRPLTSDDFSVSAEPELGLQAFAIEDLATATSTEPDSLLWDNPQAKSDRLVILSHHSLIYAHPSDVDMPNIISLFNEKKMVRDLLGNNAGMIKLESIERVTANPKAADLAIEYKPNGKTIHHKLIFSSPFVRDDVLTALKFRLGANFKQSNRSTTMEDKILSPIMILVLVAALAWGLVWGVPTLSMVPGFDTGAPHELLSSVQQLMDQIGAVTIILVAGLIGAACVVWMALNLRKPANEVILRR